MLHHGNMPGPWHNVLAPSEALLKRFDWQVDLFLWFRFPADFSDWFFGMETHLPVVG